MIIKKFVAKTEIEATEAARKELGDGVVIMNVRKVKPKGPFAFLRSKHVEVTAALEEEDKQQDSLRELRRIAQEQDARQRQKNEAAQGGKESLLGKKTPAESAAPGAESKASGTPGTASASADPASRALYGTGSAGRKPAEEADHELTETIEKKLDSLQTLLENRFNTDQAVLTGAQEKGEEAARGLQKDEEPHTPTAEELREKEVERFLRLLYNTMLDNDVDERLANEIINESQKGRPSNAGMDYILSSIYQKMILRFGRSEGITPADHTPKIIFFIGPTGVGKTTTIAKIASSLSVNDKEKVALLTTDTYRIAATDQLRTYASILGVPFRVIYSPEELSAAIEDFRDCSYIFVDTAGHSHQNELFLEQQKSYLESLPDSLETQNFLVISATTKLKDLKKIVDNYKCISDFRLIFTKLDETSSLGNLYNIRDYSGKPISYVTYGQNVPDDIEVFNAQKTVKLLLSGAE
ncbi:MAG: flagellar biosynthesis protein FlhF [Lachnospiraceae bacterium]|nr:flagellar biosynthesis protein FlhF [Lachnospiraceae bacterium]